MQIKGFIKNSLNEWEGQIASVVFLPYCNLRCPYCHAGHLIDDPDALDTVPRHEIYSYLKGEVGWVDGVSITGGEPTLHGEKLVQFVRELKALDVNVMLETNGTRPKWVGRLIDEGLLDAVAMDVKAPLTNEDYRRVARRPVDSEKIRSSVHRIVDSGLPHEFRTTLVPDLIGEDDLKRMAPELEGADKMALQNFQPDNCLDEELRSGTPYFPEDMDKFQKIFEPYVKRCVLRGRERGVSVAAAKA